MVCGPAETVESLDASTFESHRARRAPRHPPGDDRRLRQALPLLPHAQQERHLPGLDHPGFAPGAARSNVRRGDLHDQVRRVIRAVTFLGLILVFPCPWYMIAVGGVLPLPVIVSYGAAGGLVLGFWLVHLAVYTWAFHRVSRLVSAIGLSAHIPRPFEG